MNAAGFEWNRFLETGQADLWSVPPFRRAAAARLIESCEDWLAGRPNPVERDSARDRLLALWPRLMERVGVLSGSGGPEFVAAFAGVLELLGRGLPDSIAFDLRGRAPLREAWDSRPRRGRFALLASSPGEVARCFVRPGPSWTPPLEALGVPARLEDGDWIRWSIDGPVFKGRSHTGLLALCALERAGLVRLPDGPVAITAELADDGQRLLAVGDLPVKQRLWRSAFPDALLVASPPSSFKNDPAKDAWVDHGPTIVAGSLAEVALKLGDASDPQAGRARLWGGRTVSLDTLPELPVSFEWPAVLADVAGRLDQPAGILLSGSAGAGKSLLLRCLTAKFATGSFGVFGHAVVVRAVDLRNAIGDPRSRRPLLEWLTDASPAIRQARERIPVVEATGRIWVLIDGLDEVDAPFREAIARSIRESRVRYVATHRDGIGGLDAFPNPTPGRIEIPRAALARDLLAFYGRPDLEDVVAGGGLGDLAPTPLHLAMLSLVFPKGTVPSRLCQADLFRRLFDHLVDRLGRGEDGRLPPDDARDFRRSAPVVLGELALAWMARGRKGVAEADVLATVREAGFKGGDAWAYLRALEDGYLLLPDDGRWTFPHAVLAEWCAANGLAVRVAQDVTTGRATSATERSAAERRVLEGEPGIGWPAVHATPWKRAVALYGARAVDPASRARELLSSGVLLGCGTEDALHSVVSAAIDFIAEATWDTPEEARDVWAAVARWVVFGRRDEASIDQTERLVPASLARFVEAVGRHLPSDIEGLIDLVAITPDQVEALRADPSRLLGRTEGENVVPSGVLPTFWHLLDPDVPVTATRVLSAAIATGVEPPGDRVARLVRPLASSVNPLPDQDGARLREAAVRTVTVFGIPLKRPALVQILTDLRTAPLEGLARLVLGLAEPEFRFALGLLAGREPLGVTSTYARRPLLDEVVRLLEADSRIERLAPFFQELRPCSRERRALVASLESCCHRLPAFVHVTDLVDVWHSEDPHVRLRTHDGFFAPRHEEQWRHLADTGTGRARFLAIRWCGDRDGRDEVQALAAHVNAPDPELRSLVRESLRELVRRWEPAGPALPLPDEPRDDLGPLYLALAEVPGWECLVLDALGRADESDAGPLWTLAARRGLGGAVPIALAAMDRGERLPREAVAAVAELARAIDDDLFGRLLEREAWGLRALIPCLSAAQLVRMATSAAGRFEGDAIVERARVLGAGGHQAFLPPLDVLRARIAEVEKPTRDEVAALVVVPRDRAAILDKAEVVRRVLVATLRRELTVVELVQRTLAILDGDDVEVSASPGALGADFEDPGDLDIHGRQRDEAAIAELLQRLDARLQAHPEEVAGLDTLLEHPSERLQVAAFERLARAVEPHRIPEIALRALTAHQRAARTTWSGATWQATAHIESGGEGQWYVDLPDAHRKLEDSVRKALLPIDAHFRLLADLAQCPEVGTRATAYRWMGELAAPARFVEPGLSDPDPRVLRAALRAWEALHDEDAIPPVPDACRQEWTFRHHLVHLDWLVHGRPRFGERPIRSRPSVRDVEALRKQGSEALAEAVRAYGDDRTRPKAVGQRFGLPVDPVATLIERFLRLLDGEVGGPWPDEGPLGNIEVAKLLHESQGLLRDLLVRVLAGRHDVRVRPVLEALFGSMAIEDRLLAAECCETMEPSRNEDEARARWSPMAEIVATQERQHRQYARNGMRPDEGASPLDLARLPDGVRLRVAFARTSGACAAFLEWLVRYHAIFESPTFDSELNLPDPHPVWHPFLLEVVGRCGDAAQVALASLVVRKDRLDHVAAPREIAEMVLFRLPDLCDEARTILSSPDAPVGRTLFGWHSASWPDQFTKRVEQLVQHVFVFRQGSR